MNELKDNFKNRPQRCNFSSDESGLFQFALKLDEWARCLEKELRERFDQIRAHNQSILPRKKYRLMLYRNLIKEIFGEEQ